MKKCIKCLIEKELSEFSKRKASLDGTRNECKLCTSLATLSKKGEKREYDKAYHLKNSKQKSTRAREWYINNKERALANVKTYNKNHRAERNASNAERRALTGVNGDKDSILDMYREARHLGHHVDHIIPLKGKLPDGVRVNGLHTISNLQVIPPEVNLRKNCYITYEDLDLATEGLDYVFKPACSQ